MALSVPQARAVMREAIKKIFVDSVCYGGFRGCFYLSAATNFRLSAGGFSFVTHLNGTAIHKADFKGKNVTYVRAYKLLHASCTGSSCYSVGYLLEPKDPNDSIFPYVLVWSDEATAQRFADAFNRLLYAYYHHEDEEEFAAFSTAAKAWRENPAKPPLGPEADRHRILAENAIKEKNLDSAIEHYASAIEVQPMWPEGWFNLGMLYAEQNDFANAADRMKHYLELVPNAPDAQAARTNMIIWEDKAAKGQ